MKNLIFIFVLAFSVLSVTAKETTELKKVEVENVVHTDFSDEAMYSYGQQATESCCYKYHYSRRLRYWRSQYVGEHRAQRFAHEESTATCKAEEELMMAPDWNGINLYSWGC